MESVLTEAEALLLREMRNCAYLNNLCAPADTTDWRHRSFHDLILEHGRLFTPAPLPTGVNEMLPGTCYRSAGELADKTGRIYVEGVGIGVPALPFSTEHAWCADPGSSLAIDPTWLPTGAAYLGLPLAPEFRRWLQNPRVNRTHKALYGKHWEQLFRTGLPEDALVPDVGRPVPTYETEEAASS